MGFSRRGSRAPLLVLVASLSLVGAGTGIAAAAGEDGPSNMMVRPKTQDANGQRFLSVKVTNVGTCVAVGDGSPVSFGVKPVPGARYGFHHFYEAGCAGSADGDSAVLSVPAPGAEYPFDNWWLDLNNPNEACPALRDCP